ncbi:LuxR family two component transcriptional regulator [Rhodococcus sp. SMB37]|uniref:response regulator n=1 Tax=Rhodococcus sp. SMB37 TaxID=2512213 RepID=UPI0010E2C652|nr:response regulator transcription factor [Rhodococcus sp. SMB37]TCN56967.1 LuxR family two component transcriptional regulator [Rhodococcus sp. SMB37]
MTEPTSLSPASAPTTVFIADDQAMVRQGFGALLAAQHDISVVGDAPDGRIAVTEVARLRPDVVLMDVRMPEMNGLDAARQILADTREPKTRVLMLTTFDLDEYVYEALGMGASGFMLKDAPADELVRAVRVVAEGQALLAPTVTRRLIADVTSRRAPARGRARALDVLTPRELEVLELIAHGLSNQEIAAKLFVAEQTVKTHVGKVLGKLHLRDRAQAVVLAYESGVVTPG